MGQAVTVGLSGGLGNQMFQYAAGRALALKLGGPLCLDLSWFLWSKSRRYSLGAFAIAAGVSQPPLRLPDWAKAFESRISRKWGRKRMGARIYREPHFHFAPGFLDISGPVYLEGYWQSERYFSSCREVVRRDFSLREAVPAKCRPVLEQIQTSEAVCLHVRRGDYAAASGVHELCSLDYYRRGMDRIAEVARRPHAFIFSDDPIWVRENLTPSMPATVVDVNGPQEAQWDLNLMAACRHFIIANSSLSWWAAWLGASPDKRIVAPKKWFKVAGRSTGDLIPSEWQRI